MICFDMSLVITTCTVKGCVFASNQAGVVMPFPDGIPGGIAIGAKDEGAIDRWIPVVSDFLKSSLLQPQDHFFFQCSAFQNFVCDLDLMTSGIEVEVILQGYGEQEMFPSEMRIILGKGTDTWTADVFAPIHPYKCGNIVRTVGDCEDVDTLVKGISSENEDSYAREFARQARKMKSRLVAKAEESGIPEAVRAAKAIRVADYVDSFMESFRSMMTDHFLNPFEMAVESFNMDDLIAMSERLIDLSGMLKHFRDGEAGYASTREIAIVTRAEGFVWIKKA